MSKQYQPQAPFNVPAIHLVHKREKHNGMNTDTYSDGGMFFCSAKSYGGTERMVNDVYVIEDTWIIDTWYNPAFKKGDRIRFLDDNKDYEIIASPENINRRGQYMRFKVVRYSG